MAHVTVIGSGFSGLRYEIGMQDLVYQPGLAFTELFKPVVAKNSLIRQPPDSPGLHTYSFLKAAVKFNLNGAGNIGR
jgi:hypothetical protein